MGGIDVVLGLQWGDEGKGKIVDALAAGYDLVARFQGGANAGHTVSSGEDTVILHTVPSGILCAPMNLIGANVVLDPVSFKLEMDDVVRLSPDAASRLVIAKEANLILPSHKLLDKASEESKGVGKIGTTLRGIGPSYMDKVGRLGIRVGHIFSQDFKERYEGLTEHHRKILSALSFQIDEELFKKNEEDFFKAVEYLKTFRFVECSNFIHENLRQGKKILGEGAQGSMLDIDHGFAYPFVTSSTTLAAGVCTGLGVAPQRIGRVIGITKAYATRVGAGPFPTKCEPEMAEKLRQWGGEFGATTGRPRDCGWLDLVALKHAVVLSGVTELALTKIDILSNCDSIDIATAYEVEGKETREIPFEYEGITPLYKTFPGWKTTIRGAQKEEDIPAQALEYLKFVEEYVGVPVSILSTGPKREETIKRA